MGSHKGSYISRPGLKRKAQLGAGVLALVMVAAGCGNRADDAVSQAPGAAVEGAVPGDAAGAVPGVEGDVGAPTDSTGVPGDTAGVPGAETDVGAETGGAGAGGAGAGGAGAGGAGAGGAGAGAGAGGAGAGGAGAGGAGSGDAGARAGGGGGNAGAEAATGRTRAQSIAAGRPTGNGAAKPITVTGADSQGITDTGIKLGVIAPLSGAAGFLGEAEVAAIRAYTSLVNSQGGVKGRMYSTVIADSGFEPALEASAARKLVDQDKVFALFSVLGDSTGPFVTSKGIPTMVFGLNPPAFSSKYPTTHITGFSTMDSVVRMAYNLKVIQKKPINSTAILFDTANIPIGPWVKYLSAAWEAVGVEVKSTDAFNVSDGDCTSIVLKMQSLEIDFWQSAQSLNWPACAAAMGRQGYQPPQKFGGPYTSDNKFITQGGPTGMNGVYGEQVGIQVVQSFGQPYPYEGKANKNVAPLAQTYVDSIKKFAPNSADTDTLESIWTQTFWVGVQALTEAIDVQTDAITWKGINQWFHSQENYISGLIAPINFAPDCKTGSGVWLYQWIFDKKDNRFEQTSWKENGGPFTMPDSYLNKIVPGAGQCYLTKAADNEL